MMAAHASPFAVLRRQPLAVAAALAVVVLAGINWVQDPAQALRWLIRMLILPLCYLAFTLWATWIGRSRPPATDEEALKGQRYFGAALALIVVAVGIRQIALLGLEIWVRIGDHGADLDFERRILGLAAATVFLVYGNTLPKILTPLSILPLRLAERVTRARRVVGTIWVILGVAMTAAFMAMPLALAESLALWSGVAGSLTVIGAIVWMNLGPRAARHDE